MSAAQSTPQRRTVDRADVARDRIQLRAAREIIAELVTCEELARTTAVACTRIDRAHARAKRWLAADAARSKGSLTERGERGGAW